MQAIFELKTADDLTWFEADSRRYGYAHQLAFYRSILAAAALRDPRELPEQGREPRIDGGDHGRTRAASECSVTRSDE